MDHDCPNVTLPSVVGELTAHDITERDGFCVHTWFVQGNTYEAGYHLELDLMVLLRNGELVARRRGAWIPPVDLSPN